MIIPELTLEMILDLIVSCMLVVTSVCLFTVSVDFKCPLVLQIINEIPLIMWHKLYLKGCEC